MKGEPIPPTEHVVRYISSKHLEEDTFTILGTGFCAREHEHGRLSCHWFEYFEGTSAERIQCIRVVSRLTLRKSGRFAKVHVEKLINAVKKQVPDHIELQIISDPLDAEGNWPADPSHSLIVNVPDESSPFYTMVGDVIADIVSEMFLAVPE